MAVRLTVNVTAQNLDEAERVLRNLAERIAHPDEQLMRRLGDAALEDIDQRFMTRGYGTWAPNSPATIARKGHGMVLIDSGAMMSSTRIVSSMPGQLKVDVPYGGKRHDPRVPSFNHYGTKNTPARKIIEVTAKLQDALAAATVKWIENMLRALKKAV